MNVDAVIAECCKVWAPPPKVTLSQWAERNFVLSREFSSETGKFRPWSFQRGIFDAVTDPRTHTVVAMSATQMVKTTLQMAMIGYVIDRDPGPILLIQPKDDFADSFSKERLAPMLRDVECLRGRVSEAKGRAKDTLTYKAFNGGYLVITAAGSPSNLAARPVRFLLADEIDKYPASAGSEGDPISLALKRTVTFRNRRKVVLTCSPTTEHGSRILKAYNDGDRREFWIPCHACGEYQTLKFKTGVVWEHDEPSTARYLCEHCGAKWDDVQRWRAVEKGQWRAQSAFKGIASFRISELYSPIRTLADIVDDFLKKRHDNEQLKTFINTSLCEPWTEPGETLEWETLVQRREPYQPGIVPRGGLFLTAAADLQRDRIEIEIVAWGENRESWSVDYRILYGDPAEPAVWRNVEALLYEQFPTESGATLGIERLYVDSGDGRVTREVYDWVSKQPRPQVWAIKGVPHGKSPVGPPQAVETNRAGKKLAHGIVFRTVDVTYFKAGFYADLKKRPPTDDERSAGLGYPQGYCHFPVDTAYGDEHFKQICSEQLVTRKDRRNRPVTDYIQTRPRNEALDCRIYNMAAAWEFGSHRFQPQHWAALKERLAQQGKPKEPEPPKQQSPRENKWLGDRGRNWFGR